MFNLKDSISENSCQMSQDTEQSKGNYFCCNPYQVIPLIKTGRNFDISDLYRTFWFGNFTKTFTAFLCVYAKPETIDSLYFSICYYFFNHPVCRELALKKM